MSFYLLGAKIIALAPIMKIMDFSIFRKILQVKKKKISPKKKIFFCSKSTEKRFGTKIWGGSIFEGGGGIFQGGISRKLLVSVKILLNQMCLECHFTY